MTATTSKLGADMTDEQREAIESGIAAMEKCGWTHRVPVLRALLARQPAAIDKQDERGALLADHIELNMSNYDQDDVDKLNDWAIRAYDFIERAASTSANVAQVSDCTCGAKNGDAHNEACPVTHEIRHLFAMSGESASAKANVAQGAEAVGFEWPPLPAFPKPFLDSGKSGAIFTEHQMQAYANAYGEAVRAAKYPRVAGLTEREQFIRNQGYAEGLESRAAQSASASEGK